jgi:hypothetical protein
MIPFDPAAYSLGRFVAGAAGLGEFGAKITPVGSTAVPVLLWKEKCGAANRLRSTYHATAIAATNISQRRSRIVKRNMGYKTIGIIDAWRLLPITAGNPNTEMKSFPQWQQFTKRPKPLRWPAFVCDVVPPFRLFVRRHYVARFNSWAVRLHHTARLLSNAGFRMPTATELCSRPTKI